MIEQNENYFDMAIQLNNKKSVNLSIRPNYFKYKVDTKHKKEFSKVLENLCQCLHGCKESSVRNYNLPHATIFTRNASIGFNLEDRPEILKEIYEAIKEVFEMYII